MPLAVKAVRSSIVSKWKKARARAQFEIVRNVHHEFETMRKFKTEQYRDYA